MSPIYSNDKYHTIIVGGRVAGSTLAARLAKHGLRVLLLERDNLPSLPAASSPIIYAPAMRLLDELGIDETDYAHNTPCIRQWVIEGEGYFTVRQPMPDVNGRDYAYAIDRERFDAALWNHAAAMPTVDARQGYSVLDVIQDGEQVTGVKAKDLQTGEIHTFYADLVVGADGRFSTVARKVNAKTVETHDTLPTTIYYAYWCNVSPRADGISSAHMISTGGDYGLLLMDSADDSTVIAIEGRSDVVNPQGESAKQFYLRMLQSHPTVWERLQHAEMMTPVKGMKKIGNNYREAGGDAWALVGDALHQKDPLDGQGIYDALFTAKALAGAIVGWQCEGQPWQQALADYEQAVHDETQPMYHATLARVQREIYTKRPAWFMRTLARWLYEDEKYRRHWARLFVRDAKPEYWFGYRVVLLPVLRGMWRDFTKS